MKAFIYSELVNTYGTEAESIINSLDIKLTEMEEKTIDHFQILLQTVVYPFLFTVDMLKATGRARRKQRNS